MFLCPVSSTPPKAVTSVGPGLCIPVPSEASRKWPGHSVQTIDPNPSSPSGSRGQRHIAVGQPPSFCPAQLLLYRDLGKHSYLEGAKSTWCKVQKQKVVPKADFPPGLYICQRSFMLLLDHLLTMIKLVLHFRNLFHAPNSMHQRVLVKSKREIVSPNGEFHFFLARFLLAVSW